MKFTKGELLLFVIDYTDDNTAQMLITALPELCQLALVSCGGGYK